MKLNQYEWGPENDLLGSGAFAEVFKAKDNNDHYVALKIYREAVIKGSTGGSFHGKYTLEQEYKKGELLAHTNVIRYLGFEYMVHIDAMQRQASYPVLIMEFAEAGSLATWLKSPMPPNEENALKITREILNGLSYLHDQGIIHRDLKPGNILFKKDRKNNLVVKISDFGISRDVLDDHINRPSTTAGVGTIDYMAPEQLLKKNYGLDGDISNRTDLWAVGVILYRMITGKMPFGEASKGYEAIHEEIIHKEPDYSKVPVSFQPLIKACLQKHAAARPADADEALKLLDLDRKYKHAVVTPPVIDDGERTQIKQDPYQDPRRDVPPVPPKPVPVKNDWLMKMMLTVAAIIVVIVLINVVPRFFKKDVNNSSAGTNTDTIKKKTDTLAKPGDTAGKMVYTKPVDPNERTYVTDKHIVLNYGDKSYNVTYTGWLKNGLPNGQGTKVFTSGDKAGDKYVGESVNGMADGRGRQYYHDGAYFEGDFKNGMINGYGVKVDANGDKYVGDYANGYQTGQGTMYYNRDDQFKGDKYVGQWYKGAFSGQGIYYWHDGKVYDGNWENSKQNGQGTMTYLDGSKYVGEWTDGKRNGYGKAYYKDGTLLYSGQFENDVRKDH